MSKFNYLVFSGGGAAGCAYAGALEALAKQPEFSFDELKGIAGASVGAIAALIVSLNYSPQEASKTLANINLKKLQDGGCFITQGYRLLSLYGRYRGKFLFDLIKSFIKEKTGSAKPEELTFGDLKKMGCKDLYVVATKLYKKNNVYQAKRKVFSFETTPDTSVAAAVYASAAAPIFFPRVRFRKIAAGKYILDKKGHLYNDGGILDNYPIDMFDKPQYMGLPDDGKTTVINPYTLGLALRRTEKLDDADHPTVDTPINDYQPIQYAKVMINALMYQFRVEKLDTADNLARTIQIDKKGVTLNDFDMSEATKATLIASGKSAVENYFYAKQLQVNNVVSFADKKVNVGTLWQETTKQDQYFADENAMKMKLAK